MAAITHFYAEDNTLRTTTSYTHVDISASISGATLAANTKYLIVARAMLGYSTPSSGSAVLKVQTDDDSTVATKSVIHGHPLSGWTSTDDYVPYFYVGSYTTSATPALLTFQAGGDGAATVRVDQASLLVIDLDAIGTAGTDYFEASSSGTAEISNVADTTKLAEIAGSSLGTDEYLILGYGRWKSNWSSRWNDTYIKVANDGSTQTRVAGHKQENALAANEMTIAGFAVRHKASSGTPAATIYSQNEDTAGNHVEAGGYMIALPTAIFADFEWDYTSGNVSVSSEATVATVGPYTPSVSGEHLIFGRAQNAVGAEAATYSRLHLEDGTTPTRTGDSTVGHTMVYDAAKDEGQAVTFERISVSAEKTFNLRGTRSTGTNMHSRWLILVNMNDPVVAKSGSFSISGGLNVDNDISGKKGANSSLSESGGLNVDNDISGKKAVNAKSYGKTGIIGTVGPLTTTPRSQSVTTTGFDLKLQHQERNVSDPYDTHAVHTVAWEVGSDDGVTDPFAWETLLKTGVDSAGATVTFTNTYSSVDFFADANTYVGADPITIRTSSYSASAATIFPAEETSLDAETNHGAESIGTLAIDQGASSSVLETGRATGVNHNWQYVSFSAQYADPVLILGPATTGGSDPGVVQAMGLNGSGFYLRFREWEYLDQNHGTAESVSWMIIEKGTHPLSSGSKLNATVHTANGASTTKRHGAPFTFTQYPQGDWVGNYGTDGYSLLAFNGGTSEEESLPAGVSLSLDTGTRYQWTGSSTEVRAVEDPTETTRKASAWYHATEVQATLSFTSAYVGTLRLYALDWDATDRRQTITVNDGKGAQTLTMDASFHDGGWVEFSIDVAAAGSVSIDVTKVAGTNAVVSGIFLDPVSATFSAAPVVMFGMVRPDIVTITGFKTDTATHGTDAIVGDIIHATADNEMTFFVNGTQVATTTDWQTGQVVITDLEPGDILAVEGVDTGGAAAFIADIWVNGVRFGTSSKWKVSTTNPAGWKEAGFNDSSWAAATEYGAYGITPWFTNVNNFPTDSTAQWIWTTDNVNDDAAYFRFKVSSVTHTTDAHLVDRPVAANTTDANVAATSITSVINIPSVDPGTNAGHYVHVRTFKVNAGDSSSLAVELRENAVVIQSWTIAPTTTPTTYTQAITAANAANIVDYADLKIALTFTYSGDPDDHRVTWIALDLPVTHQTDAVVVVGSAISGSGGPTAEAISGQKGALAALVESTGHAVTTIVENPVSDGYSYYASPSTRTLYSNTTSIQWGRANFSYISYNPWFRYSTVAIPQHANLIDVKVTATNIFYNNYSGYVWLDLYANKAGNATSPFSYDNYWEKTRTNSVYSVSDSLWDNPVDTTFDVTSDNLIPIIEEVINRSDWASGNSLMLLGRWRNGGTPYYGKASLYSIEGGTSAQEVILTVIFYTTHKIVGQNARNGVISESGGGDGTVTGLRTETRTHDTDANVAAISLTSIIDIPAIDPGTNAGHYVNVRTRKVNATDSSVLTVELRENAVVIQSWTITPTTTWATYTETITSNNASQITDYADLRVAFRFVYSGSPGDHQISWVSLDLPITHTVNAIVVTRSAQLQDVDAVLVERSALDHGAEALIVQEQTVTQGADAHLVTRQGLSDTTDALVATTSTTTVLETPATDPGVDTGHSINVRTRKVNAGDHSTLTVELRQNGTPIESYTIEPTTTWATYQHFFDPSNIANITDYSELEVALTFYYSGDPEDHQVAWVQLLVPALVPIIDHTTDANLIGKGTRTFITDAWITGLGDAYHTTDAILRATEILAFGADALLRATETSTHGADAHLITRLFNTHATDAVLRASETNTHGADAHIVSRPASDHTTDAVLRATETVNHDVDGHLVSRIVVDAANDAHLVDRIATTHSADGHLVNQISTAHDTDAYVVVQYVTDHGAEALIVQEQTVTQGADAHLVNRITPVHGADANIATTSNTVVLEIPATDPGINSGHFVHVRARKVNAGDTSFLTVEFRQDGVDIQTWVIELTDSWVTYIEPIDPANVANITDYSELEIALTFYYSGDPADHQVSWVQLELPEPLFIVDHTTDALIIKPPDAQHTTDAWIAGQATDIHNTDAILQITLSSGHNADALLVTEGITTNENDAHLVMVRGGGFLNDAHLVERHTPVHGVNAILRTTETIDHNLNAIVINRLSVETTTDAILVTRLDQTYDLDAHLVTRSGVENDVDAHVVSRTQLAHIADALLVQEETNTHSANAHIVGRVVVAQAVDALLVAISGTAIIEIPSIDPGIDTGHFLQVRTRKVNSGDYSVLTVELRQDGTLIEAYQIQVTDTWTTYVHSLSALNIATITDYAELEVWLTFAYTGNPADHQVSWVQLELPAPLFLSTHLADALLVERQEATHITDAWIHGLGDAYHATDAHLVAEGGTNHTTGAILVSRIIVDTDTDAILVGQYATDHTTDAALSQSTISAHNTDATLVSRVTTDHSVGAILVERTTTAHNTDVTLSTRTSTDHDTDGVLRATNETAHDVDAILLQTVAIDHETDASLFGSTAVDHGADGLLLKDQTATYETNAVLRSTVTTSSTVDAILVTRLSDSHTSDAVLRASLTTSHPTEAILVDQWVEDHDADAVLRASVTAGHATDAVLRATVATGHATDVLLSSRLVATNENDAVLRGTYTTEHDTDAYVVVQHSVDSDTDAILRSTVEVTHDTDAIVPLRATLSTQNDAVLQATVVTSHDTNAIILSVETLDTTTDAILRTTGTLSHGTNAFISDPLGPGPDGWAQQEVDAVLRGTYTTDHGVDADLDARLKPRWGILGI